ncbi:hypothetical protein BOX15_Mlig019828g3 [Macrostomum lignano]|uniref:Glyco_hydro_1 domain-containing protein n=1 Tax=Macrostomum lignano TaxID=282301 RepID=A0A267DDN1_9PLAT|nr:hypothetical protein BOX15_Mlig019828g3 [Macrostomum lignano]
MTLQMPLVAAISLTLLLTSMSRQCTAQEFIWGTATSSYQIEGAWDVDGKGMSIWDEFVRRNGTTIKDNSTGDIACRSYEKYKEDVQLLKQLGVNGYRFSISWPRVLPNGTLAGGINEKGIQYYVNLVDELLANGIQPMATLYHWDLPLTLQNEFEGWESEQIIPHFVDYAKLMFEKLGDKVKWWITFNEPWVFNVVGNGEGRHAPGKKELKTTLYIVGHNLLRAHAKAYRIYEKDFKPRRAKLASRSMAPTSCRRTRPANWTRKPLRDGVHVWLVLRPGVLRRLPEEMKTRIGNKSAAAGLPKSRLPEFTADEKAELKGSSDFFGLNYYTSSIAEHKILSNDGGYYDDQDLVSSLDPSWPGSGSIWLKVTPFGIREGIKWLSERYDNPPLWSRRTEFLTMTGPPVTNTGLTSTESTSATLRRPRTSSSAT